MKILIVVFIFIFLTNCSKQKTVLICGDHICVNNKEAEQYFEKNLSIEVKIVKDKTKEEADLVELNLNNNSDGIKEVRLFSKKKTNKKIKKLSKNEVLKIKKDIKKKEKEKNILKKMAKKNNIKESIKSKTIEKEKIEISQNKIINKSVNKKKKDVVDVCTIIKKCSIEEISKYLLKQGKKKDFPDITTRQ